MLKDHGFYRLATITQSGSTASASLEGNTRIRDRIAQAKRDPNIRYGYLVEVLDDGETKVVEEWFGPPADGTVVNDFSDYQAVAHSGSWSLRLPVSGQNRGPDWNVPTERVPEKAMSPLLYFARTHGIDCYEAGKAAGRRELQGDLRRLLGTGSGTDQS